MATLAPLALGSPGIIYHVSGTLKKGRFLIFATNVCGILLRETPNYSMMYTIIQSTGTSYTIHSLLVFIGVRLAKEAKCCVRIYANTATAPIVKWKTKTLHSNLESGRYENS